MKKMRICMICMQDFGGAGTAALRLHIGLLRIGINSTFIALRLKKAVENTKKIPSIKKWRDLETKEYSLAWDRYWERMERFLSYYSKRPVVTFSDTFSYSRISSMIDANEADIIHFHWISGVVNLEKELDFLKKKKIVWTLHDMNPFTGGCHYSFGCDRYKVECLMCPQLGSNNRMDLSNRIWKTKMQVYSNLDITVVTPSAWLAKCAKESALLKKFPVHVIPNGVPVDIYQPCHLHVSRKNLFFEDINFTILFGADNILDPRKGFSIFLEAIMITKNRISEKFGIIVFGNDSHKFPDIPGIPVMRMGYIDSEQYLALIYNMATICVIPSLEDNFPNIILESLSCGTPVVGFRSGGISEIVIHGFNGYLASVGDPEGLSDGILWAMNKKNYMDEIKKNCRYTILSKYTIENQAILYQEIYESIYIR